MHGVVHKVVSEMEALAMSFDDCTIDMIQCDTIVQSHTTYHKVDFPMDLHKIKWKGFGGTDMKPAFALAKKLNPAAIVCLTDGEIGDPPENPGKPTIWLLTDANMTMPYGMIAHVGDEK